MIYLLAVRYPPRAGEESPAWLPEHRGAAGDRREAVRQQTRSRGTGQCWEQCQPGSQRPPLPSWLCQRSSARPRAKHSLGTVPAGTEGRLSPFRATSIQACSSGNQGHSLSRSLLSLLTLCLCFVGVSAAGSGSLWSSHPVSLQSRSQGTMPGTACSWDCFLPLTA